jgi:hypothetical protein
MCNGVLVAAQRRAIFPVFWGISGSTRATLNMSESIHEQKENVMSDQAKQSETKIVRTK